jgi:CHRD domain
MSTTSLSAALIALCCAVPAAAQTAKKPATHAATSGGVYVAVLEGGYAVPPAETQANGTAELTWTGKELRYHVRVDDIKDVTGAFIHIGRAGEEAPAVADLFDGYREGPLSGTLAEGTLTRTRVHGTTMARLLRALRQDDAYVTVHTRTHPDCEIRGQLRAQPTVAHR